MKIAIDKNSLNVPFNDDDDYVYLFDDEKLDDLLKTKQHCLYYKLCNYVDINLSRFDIPCIKKANLKDNNWHDLPQLSMKKIGIIVPNYNYEHTIEKCLNSIFNQTYKNYEIIFVDDCSTDNSIDVAQTTYLKYCARELGKSKVDSEWAELPKNFKLVRLKQKRLNGGARNEGYLHLSDDVDYVYYVDSDDWLQNENALRDINVKLQNNPDVLFVSINSYKNGVESQCITPSYIDKYQAMLGWSGSCGKVIKKELATRQDCLYAEGTLKEDRNQHRRICINMKTFNILEKPVYVWNQDNHKSITTIREKVLWGTSTIRQYADTLQLYLSVKGVDKQVDRILEESLKLCKEEVLNDGDKQY